MYSGEMLTGDHFSVPFSRWSSFTCKSRVRVGLVDRNVSHVIRARCLRRFASTQQVDRWRTYMYLDKHSSHLICLSGRHGLYRSRGFTETAMWISEAEATIYKHIHWTACVLSRRCPTIDCASVQTLWMKVDITRQDRWIVWAGDPAPV